MEELTIDNALGAAHLPALVAALIHITGDESWLRPEWRPRYNPLASGEIGVSAEEQARLRAAARPVLQAFAAGAVPSAAPLALSTILKIMDFVAGAEIPEGYADFLMDELAIDRVSSKEPDWRAPALAAKAKGMKVLVIGAGMSGLLAGIRLSHAGVPFEIIEKNADVGGTWLENTYPGCRVDSPNHMYSYSFEPNHQWPNHFSPQPVLLDYFRNVAERHRLRQFIRFETEVIEAVYDEPRALWRVLLRERSGSENWVEATAVITAVGQLNRPRFPEIKGRESFKGAAFHSGQWRHDVPLTGKRVAVIGAGASAFQFVPEIAGKVERLSVFQRSPPWIFPTPHYHDRVPEGMKWLLETLPNYEKWYRFFLFWMATDGLLAAVRVDPGWSGPASAVSETNMQFRKMVSAVLAEQLGERQDLLDKVIPDYPIGGKRALLGTNAWIEALKRDNVDLVTAPIREITETSIIAEDGTQHDVDVIIYATGFHATRFLFPMRFVGRGGIDLHTHWNGDPRAYLGMTVPRFPNLFMIYGPNTNLVVNGSIIFFSECGVRYVLGCLKLLAESGAASIECRQEIHDTFNSRIDAGNSKMAWGVPSVSNWYKNEKGRVTQNWPFALVDYWRATIAPDLADFILASPMAAMQEQFP